MKVHVSTLSNKELMLFIKQNINKYARDKRKQGLLIDYYALLHTSDILNYTGAQGVRDRTIELITILFGETIRKPVENN